MSSYINGQKKEGWGERKNQKRVGGKTEGDSTEGKKDWKRRTNWFGEGRREDQGKERRKEAKRMVVRMKGERKERRMDK